MKRLIILLVAIASLIAIGLSALPWIISSKGIERQFSERVFELSGLKASYQGDIQLTLFPFLGLELENVNFVDPNAEADVQLLHMDRLRMQLQLLPLLTGNIKFSTFSFIRPELNIQLDENGKTNWHIQQGTIREYIENIANTLKQNAGKQNVGKQNANDPDPKKSNIEDVNIGQFSITDGSLKIDNQQSSEPIVITGLSAFADWPNLSAGLHLSGGGVWKGEQFKFTNTTLSPIDLVAGGKSQVVFTWSSAPLSGDFAGDAQFLSGIHLLGQGKISTPSLARLSELFNMNFNSESVLDEFSLEGKVSANSGEIRFDEATANVDGNQAVGLLQLNWQGDARAKISGTLAFDSLDISPFLARLPDDKADLDKPHAPGSIDFDVRISATQTILRDKTFGLLAATAVVQKDEWSLDIGEAEIFGGSLSGTVSATKTDEKYLLNIKGQVRNLAVGDLTQSYYQQGTFINGTAKAEFDLSAKTHELTKNLRNYSGTMKVELIDGQIVGLDLRKAIPALGQEDSVVRAEDMTGDTPFGKLNFGILVSNGIAWLSKGSPDTQEQLANDFHLFGKFDFLRGGLAIYADIATSDEPPVNKRIFIGGTFDNPLVTRTPVSNPSPNPPSQ